MTDDQADALDERSSGLNKNLDIAAAKWDAEHGKKQTSPLWSWWSEPAIANYLAKLICGEACDRVADLPVLGIKKYCARDIPFERAISVGCGAGNKEISLLQNGLVKHFTLYDISQEALNKVRASAEKAGLTDALRLVRADAFRDERGKFDMVYWDNALHHMMDAHAALSWSKRRLKRGGALVVNDFVGPSRFQWDEELLSMCNEMVSYFGVPPTCKTDAQELERIDPTEAADSGRIKDALLRYFPDALWIPLGGALYFVGFTGKPVKFTPDSLVTMIGLDARLNAAGMYVYAFAVGKKA
ncbi:MAG: class I SAM-dependent methyltransferase [Desulfovibrionaceae bacterium]|nr:class I SAM-dependent methyltransferase [Desulfovibrionaceae bacterium]